MTLIKALGLTTVAAIAVTAFVGTSAAMAESNTDLCWANESPCAEENQVEGLFSMLTGTVILKGGFTSILCLHSVLQGEKLALATAPESLVIHIHSLDFLGCGTNSEHNNCPKTVNQPLPLLDVLKTASNLATVQLLGASIKVECPLFTCAYNETTKAFSFEGAEHTKGAGNGMLTFNEVEFAEPEGFFCPEKIFLTALYEPSEPLYIVE